MVNDIAMSDTGRSIVKSEGWAHMKVTVRCNDTTALYPGAVVTRDGETVPDVCLLDGLGDTPFAVLGLPADQDIDTAFTDNDEVVAYMMGSGAVVKCLMIDGMLAAAGEPLYADPSATGYVVPVHHMASLGMNAASLATILPRMARAYVGRSLYQVATYASLQPVWVALV